MKILLISHLFPKASDRRHGIFVLRRAELLRAEGHDVTVVSPVPYIPKALKLFQRWRRYQLQNDYIHVSGFEVHRPAYFRPPGAWFIGFESISMWFGIKRTIQRLKNIKNFDLILAEDFRSDVGAACKASRILGIPCVGVSIGGDLNTDVHTSKKAYTTITKNIYQCHRIICESEALCSRIKCLTGGRCSGVNVIRGTDTERFRPVKPDKRKALREEFGWFDEEIIILYVGYLEKNKGIYELLDAFDVVNEAYPLIKLVVIGDGSERTKFKEMAFRSPFKHNIKILGHLDHDEIHTFYQAADMLALPSYMEGLPNAVVEGIACGLPILATRVGGVPQVAPDEHIGLLVPPKNSKILAKSMERLVLDKDLRATLGRAGRAHAELYYSASRNIHRFIDVLIETIINEKKDESTFRYNKVQMVDITSNSPFYTERLANALSRYQGIHCRACTNWMDWNWYKKSGIHDDLMAWIFRLKKLWPNLTSCRKIWRILRTIGYITAWTQVIGRGVWQSHKIIHVQWCMVPILDIHIFILLRFLGFKIVYTVHNALPHGERDKVTKWKYRQLYRLAHALIVLGEQVGNDIAEWVLAGAEKKMHVIEHGLLMPQKPIPPKDAARRRLKLLKEDEVVLYFGGISLHKGIIDLIDAISIAVLRRPKIKFIIAGIPHEPFSPYEKHICQLGLVDKIRSWPEFVTEEFKITLYAAADISVLPHRDPSQSAMGLEALAFGKPIIVTNAGALPTLIDNGRNGYVVPVQDPTAIAGALLGFFNQTKKKQKAMAESSRQFGLQRFNWDVIAAKHIALYRSLL